jgi:hypothetical protein
MPNGKTVVDLAYDGRTAVAGRGVVALPGRGVTFCNPVHLGELLEQVVAKCEGASVVMVHRDACDGWGFPVKLTDKTPVPAFISDAIAAGYQVEPAGLAWQVNVRPPAGGAWRRFYFLPYDRRQVCGPWSTADSFQQLVLGLSRFAHSTGLAWAGSTGRTAQRLITSTHPREKGGTVMDRSPVVPAPAEDGGLEQPFTWRRPLTPAEAGSRWVHHVDLNSAYLAAWQTVELGVGEPAHHPRGIEFSHATAGLWRLDPDYGKALMADDRARALPLPWAPDRDWVTTPTLRRIIEVMSSPPRVLEAYTWPAKSRYLRGAAERLRDARVELTGDQGAAARMALSAVKGLYRVETGRFNMAAADERSPWRRPDWGHFVRAQARVNLHRTLAGYPVKDGYREGLRVAPFAITTDDLLFVSEISDVAEFAGEIGLPWGAGLGQFKAKTTVRLEELPQLLEPGNAKAAFDAVRAAAAKVPA